MEYINLFPVGIAIATFASLVGIGGGLIWAPYLILVVKLPPQDAILISLMIQIFGMGSASFNFLRRKLIFWPLALSLFPFIILGMLAGALLSQAISKGNIIQAGLGSISMATAILFAFQNEKYDQQLQHDQTIKAPVKIKFLGAAFAGFSGLFSTGIGDFIVPIFRARLRLPMQNAIGTSLLLNFSAALFGGLTHLILRGGISPSLIFAVLFGGLGVIIGGQIGPFIARRISESRMREVFIFILLLIGLHLIYQSL